MKKLALVTATVSTLFVASQNRSSHWDSLRDAHLESHPACEACGQTDSLNVHHEIPFSKDPSKELDPDNLITLCTDGPGHMNCHLIFGHGGNYKCYNPKVREDVRAFRIILSHRTEVKSK